MEPVRRAKREDLVRIAEMIVFNYRLNFYPIFQNDSFYFHEMQVPTLVERYRSDMDSFWVYDDSVVKGCMQVQDGELKKLFVEPVLQGRSIGSVLLDYAVDKLNVRFLWALEKNRRAIAFYQRHGFRLTADRMSEEGTQEFLIRMER